MLKIQYKIFLQEFKDHFQNEYEYFFTTYFEWYIILSFILNKLSIYR